MNNEFVSYEIATALKQLGFDEECIAFYKENSHLKAIDQHWGMSISGISKKLGYEVEDLILAPTYSRVFRWFRENYKLDKKIGIVFNSDVKKYNFQIYKEKENVYPYDRNTSKYFDFFEEVELECLKKLIEIISAKKE